MGTHTLHDAITTLRAANTTADEAIATILTTAHQIHPDDRENAHALLEAAEAIGRSEQARHGQLIQLLAQIDRIRANKGGLAPWIATHLDVTPGRSRAIAQSARRIGHLPELAAPLASGNVGAETVRTLTRAARAIEHTDHDQAATLTTTLDLAANEGASAANRHIRELEESLDPGHAQERLAKQRKRSFARITKIENGMCRLEVLLDPVRATTVRAAIDQQTAAWIRARQYDRADPLPDDVRSIEQLQAQAVTRLAEVFLNADPAVRGADFTPSTLYYVSLLESDGLLAESVYGDLMPRSAVAPKGDNAARLLEHLDGRPMFLDGMPIDTEPTARLATASQRVALGFRDRQCTHPGCTRPVTWSLNARHQIPYSKGGPTTLDNLVLLCAEHHTLTHHPDQRE